MKISIVSQWYDPETGSAGVPASIARALVARGHSVSVVTGFPNYPYGRIYPGYRVSWRASEVRDGVQVTRVPLYPSHEARAVRRMLSYLSFAVSAAVLGWSRLRRADVVLVYSTPATVVLPALLVRWTARVPYVLLVQDLWPETVTASGFLPASLRTVVEAVLHPFCDLAYRFASAIAVTSPGMSDRILARRVSRLAPVLVTNWADESIFGQREPRPEVVGSLGPWRPFTAMYAGSLGEVQGVEVLIEAAELLRDRDDVELVVVGTGVLEAELRRSVADRGLDNIRFLGQQPLDVMPDLLQRSDVQIVTLKDLPLFRLTLPSKIQVALAMGRPVVGAVAGDAADLLTAAGAGFVVPPGDAAALARAVQRLADLPAEQRAELGRRGRSYYEEHLSERAGSAAIETMLLGAAR
ncbi:glycosyltransferase family 4 protein [Angustibacter sp. McL0619]|uniref:glycosyltransferase family 4 protein n=1 Tax=Angustibacter sp. McL0619 TaxID=3415676 RepID=UPI003CF6AA13